MQIRLFLAGSDEIARAGVRIMLDQAEHIKIIGEAGTSYGVGYL